MSYTTLEPMQAYGGDLSPQGFWGNLIGRVAQPVGGFIGGALGNRQLGSQIGGIAGQLGRLLPFEVDPVTAAYAQQQAAAQQLAAQQLVAQQLAAELAPQGFWGDLIGRVAQPVGSFIGGGLGNRQLGSQIGGIVGQAGRLLPFGVDPMMPANGGGQLSVQGILLPQSTMDPEAQAMSDFFQSATSGVTKRLYDYLQANEQQHPQLAEVKPLVQRAAELFEQRDYNRAFVQAFQAYRAVALLRSKTPTMPAL